jgi:hypothetical protein
MAEHQATTVRKLIEQLSKFDPDATVVIEDADTAWPLHVTRVEHGRGDWSGLVVLAGEYGAEWSRPGTD